MKYYRGYLVAGIFAALSWLLMQLGQRLSQLVDMVYPFLTRSIQSFLAFFNAGTDVCVWQVAAVVLGAVGLATVVLMIIFRWNPFQWLGWVLSAASILFFIHTAMFGLNHYAGPISDDVRLTMTQYSVTELENATEYYLRQANSLAQQMPRDSQGRPVYDDFDALAEKAGQGFEVLTYDHSYAVFAGSTLPVKKLGWADMYTSMGITGLTMPLTGEAAVNPQIPPVSLPFTMCHEMAHRMSIAPERDANFAGFLACRFHPDPAFQYSGYFMAYSYCINALTAVGGDGAQAASLLRAEESPQLRQDLNDYYQFFDSKKDEKATKVADQVNDTYIKASGDKDGILSYDQVAAYLVNWHLQQVVAPSLAEEEKKFDPLDETQVDLSGLPYTPTVAEPEE